MFFLFLLRVRDRLLIMSLFDIVCGECCGGGAVRRNFLEEEREMELLQKKWGKQIVRWDCQDRCHRRKKVKRHFDRNPIIRPPIRGV